MRQNSCQVSIWGDDGEIRGFNGGVNHIAVKAMGNDGVAGMETVRLKIKGTVNGKSKIYNSNS